MASPSTNLLADEVTMACQQSQATERKHRRSSSAASSPLLNSDTYGDRCRLTQGDIILSFAGHLGPSGSLDVRQQFPYSTVSST